MYSVFITGGTGFVGRSLLRYIKSNFNNHLFDLQVCVLSRNPENLLTSFPEFSDLPWLSFHRGNILEPFSLPDQSFDYCIHAAADTSLSSRENLLGWFDEIVSGTRFLLDWALRNSVKRFLYLSSGAVYGRHPFAGFDPGNRYFENQNVITNPLDTSNLYGLAKLTSEHLCNIYFQQYGLHTIIARLFSFVGPDISLNSHQAISCFIREALYSDNISVNGDGSPIRSYLYQDDLAHWLFTLLQEGAVGEAYNIGSDYPISILNLASLIRDLLAPNKSVHVSNYTAPHSHRTIYVPSIEKIMSRHHVSTSVSLTNAIIRTVRLHPSLKNG